MTQSALWGSNDQISRPQIPFKSNGPIFKLQGNFYDLPVFFRICWVLGLGALLGFAGLGFGHSSSDAEEGVTHLPTDTEKLQQTTDN
jgi:hypothetical protein